MEKKASHCLVLTYPSVGHVNPLRQFSKRLHHKGLTVTLVVTEFFRRTHRVVSDDSLSIETISDGYDEGGIDSAESVQAYLDTFWTVGPETLSRLVGDLSGSSNRGPVDCIVYDAFLPWGLHVARKLGISAAPFFTQSCAVNAVYYHVSKGFMGIPVSSPVTLPGLVPLAVTDLPSFVSDAESTYPAVLKLVVDQFANVEGVDWILCNSIFEIEHEAANWMMTIFPLRTVGPTIPSMLLDKRIEGDKQYGSTLPNHEAEASMEWLNSHPIRSVVYVSFGTLVAVKAEQMEEVVCGLRKLDRPFLWVVRSSEKDKLPKGFTEESSLKKGLVVSWCNQLEVLASDKVGCFVTHCGWNSTLEALSLGVPMVSLPQWTDQFTNAKHIADVWKVGVRGERDGSGIVRREVLEKCVNEVMDGERSEEIRENATEWMELIKGAMSEGGSSDKNIDEFISSMDHNL